MNSANKKSLDIALIQPPGWANQNPPLGLALLKSYLSRDGFLVETYDLNILLYNLRHGIYSDAWELSNGYYTWGNASYIKKMFGVYENEVTNFIYAVLSSSPKVIGISVHWSSIISAKLLAQKFKQYAPGIKIVFGGPQVAYYTHEWRDILKGGIIDAVIFGEGEESLKNYMQILNAPDAGPIKGVAYVGRNNEIVDGGVRDLVKSLDSLPFPDFSGFDMNLYIGHNVIPTYFSRGCINRCCYCTENKFFPYFRNRTGKRLFEEVTHQLSLYPDTAYFRMHDSVSNGNIKELEVFCDLLIDNNVKIRFNLENAVIRKEMNDRLYKKLKAAGCTLIGYGLETPSKRLLEYVGKAACLDADFEKVIIDGAKNNMTIGINMMFGLPGEKEEDFNAQLEFIRRVKKYRRKIIINPALNFCYFPEGCEAYSNPGKFNVDLAYGELYWESKDGSNTFMDRISKFERFCVSADRLGYENLFGVMENANKNALLGQYYSIKKDHKEALGFLLRSFDHEIKTVELAGDIIRLYKQIGAAPDEAYDRVRAFMESETRDSGHWIDSINDRRSLGELMLRQSASDSTERLNRFIESRRNHQTVRFRWSFSGLKACIKHIIFKVSGRTIHGIDDKYVVSKQLSQEMDNKRETERSL